MAHQTTGSFVPAILFAVFSTVVLNVVAGEVDHHNYVLTLQEKLANNVMHTCVSRCKRATLTIDVRARCQWLEEKSKHQVREEWLACRGLGERTRPQPAAADDHE